MSEVIQSSPRVPTSLGREERRELAAMWLQHAGPARAYALTLTHRYDPDDLVSEAFSRILQRISLHHPVGRSFRPYLLRTIRNIAIDWSRRDREVATPVLPEEPDLITPEHIIVTREPWEGVTEAFGQMPEGWKRVLWLTEVEGMKPKQVAALLHMTPGAVAQMTFRARRNLRERWIRRHIETNIADNECARVLEAWSQCSNQDEPHFVECVECRDFVFQFSTLPKSRA